MSEKHSKTDFPTLEAQIALLQAQLASLARDNESLAHDNARLIAEATQLSAEAAEKDLLITSMSTKMDCLEAKVEGLEAKMARLIEQIKLANMRFFGSKSEKVIPEQLSLFNDTEAWADPSQTEPDLVNGRNIPVKPRKRGGRRRIDTSKLERVVIEHTIEDALCPHCSEPMSEMKIEVREVIRLVPAHLVVEEHRRHVYKCQTCCAANAKGTDVASQIVRAPMPTLTPIPHSFASASMLSYVINAKYANSMPYYRLEQDFRSIGADISRQDMANWTINVYERWLSLIHVRMKEKLLKCKYINADETAVQVLKEPDRLAKQKSYMWLFRSGPHEIPNCIFEYHPTRSGDVPHAFLKGWSGYLTTDGYDPYFNLGIKGITNTACLVHIRRKFAEIVKVAGGDAACEGVNSLALEARRRIDRIFRIDKKFNSMDPQARLEARNEKLKPHMESFRAWAEVAITKAVPNMPLHKALTYALKYWPYVMNVLKDGHLGLDNNISERAIKSFVIGRKNWLFSDTPKGASASAAIYSIVITAKLNGLNQRAYLEWVLTEMPNDTELSNPDRIDRYLPWSNAVPSECRLDSEITKKAAELRDEPIVDPKVIESVLENS